MPCGPHCMHAPGGVYDANGTTCSFNAHAAFALLESVLGQKGLLLADVALTPMPACQAFRPFQGPCCRTSAVRHRRGLVACANQNQPNTNGSQVISRPCCRAGWLPCWLAGCWGALVSSGLAGTLARQGRGLCVRLARPGHGCGHASLRVCGTCVPASQSHHTCVPSPWPWPCTVAMHMNCTPACATLRPPARLPPAIPPTPPRLPGVVVVLHHA